MEFDSRDELEAAEAELANPDNIVVGQATVYLRAATGCEVSQSILELFERKLVLISSLDGEPHVKLTKLGVEVALDSQGLFPDTDF